MPCSTPISIRHEVPALAHEGIRQSAIASHGSDSCYHQAHLLEAYCHWNLVTGKSMDGGSSEDHTSSRPCFVQDVWQDRFISARTLMAQMRNLYGMRAVCKTINDRLLSHGHHAYRPTRKPLLTTAVSTYLRTEVAKPDNGPLAAYHLRWRVQIPTLPGRVRA